MTHAQLPIIETYETARLRIRHWAAELGETAARQSLERDLKDVLTPTVLAPLPPSLHLTGPDADIGVWVADRAAESDVLTIRLASGGALVGLLILARSHPMSAGKDETVHLGYLLAERFWGMGYATEVVAGLTQAVARTGGIGLSAGVALDNPASAKVLKNAGFTRAAKFGTADTDVYLWPGPRP